MEAVVPLKKRKVSKNHDDGNEVRSRPRSREEERETLGPGGDSGERKSCLFSMCLVSRGGEKKGRKRRQVIGMEEEKN